MNIIPVSESEAAEKAGAYLNGLLRNNQQKPVLLLLSGGSALSILPYIHEELLGPHVTISVLDERYSVDHTVNNFSQISHTSFYKLAYMWHARFIDTRVTEGLSQELLARQLESQLRMWKHQNPQGEVIVTQGIGIDGHTAGILPKVFDKNRFIQLFDNDLKWVEEYDAKNTNEYPLRVTVTLPFLRKIVDHSIVFVVGNEKQDILSRVLLTDDLYTYPASVIRSMRDVVLVTDLQI